MSTTTNTQLIAAIVATCGVTPERAAKELQAAKMAARSLGITVQDVLMASGYIGAPTKANGKHETSRSVLRSHKRDHAIAVAFSGSAA